MATYVITAPDGKEYEVDAPQGASQDDALKYFQSNWKQPQSAVVAPSSSPSLAGSLGRQLGLTARHGIKGALAIPAMLGDAMGAGSSQSVENLVNMMGLPKPEGSTEKLAQGVSEAMAGGGGMTALGRGMIGAVSPAIKSIGGLLSANPAQQVALSGVSGGATEMARESGAGPVGQTLAAVGAPLAAGTIAPIASKIAQIPYNIIAPMVSKDAANVGAARMMNDITGSRAGGVANSLTQATPGQTAGQAALDTGSSEMQAAQKLLRARRPSEYVAIDAAQKADLKNQWKALNQNTDAIRTKALDDANYGGVRADSITNEIDSILGTAGSGRASKVVEGALNEVKARIGKFTDQTSGLIDAKDLYDIRKKIGTTIKTYAKENADWDKTLASGLERDIQKAIDKEIVGAGGGQNWVKYLSEYSKEAQRLSKIKDSEKTARTFASQGMNEARTLMNKNENPVQGINFLDRAITLTNAALRRSEAAGGRRIEQAAADLMMPKNMGGDPRTLGLLMMQEARNPTTLDSIIRNASIVPRVAAMGLLTPRE